MEQPPLSFEIADAIVTDHCHLRIPSLPERIAEVVDFLIERARKCGTVPANRANRLTVALHEALTNSVIHGNLGVSSELKLVSDQAFAEAVAVRCADPAFASRVVDVQASYDGRSSRWVLTDQGDGFDVARALYRVEHEAPDPLQPSGRGLFLMRAFVDEMRYDDHGRRLTLAMKRLDEKRGWPRFPFGQEVRIDPIDSAGQVHQEAGFEAHARDISARGIGFLQEHLADSTRVLITIPTRDEPISLPARVSRWQQVGDVVEVGCSFESVGMGPGGTCPPESQSSGELAALMDRLAEQQKPLAERRAAPRLPYTESITIEHGEQSMRGFARDLSRSGIAFFSTSSLPLGVIRLGLPQQEGKPAISVRATVVRCTRLTEGFYDVAARFLPS
jgi:anti-sigma regulatory factor (Ser/Thr protein kinase)